MRDSSQLWSELEKNSRLDMLRRQFCFKMEDGKVCEVEDLSEKYQLTQVGNWRCVGFRLCWLPWAKCVKLVHVSLKRSRKKLTKTQSSRARHEQLYRKGRGNVKAYRGMEYAGLSQVSTLGNKKRNVPLVKHVHVPGEAKRRGEYVARQLPNEG